MRSSDSYVCLLNNLDHLTLVFIFPIGVIILCQIQQWILLLISLVNYCNIIFHSITGIDIAKLTGEGFTFDSMFQKELSEN